MNISVITREEAIVKIRNGAFVPLKILFSLGFTAQEIPPLYKSVSLPPVMVGAGPGLTLEMIKEAYSQALSQE